MKPVSIEQSNSWLPPGSVIGIVGGGQLGRMMAIAASRLGYYTAILSSDSNAPAVQVSHRHIHCDFDDLQGLEELANYGDVVTYELEQLPLNSMQWVAERCYLAPSIYALDISQNRVREKRFLNSIDVPTTPWKECRSISEVTAALKCFGRTSILKVAFGGYDGKGQVKIEPDITTTELVESWDRLSSGQEMVTILEAAVEFDCELSVVIARDKNGQCSSYDAVRNIHKNHILDTTTVPAGINPEVALRAQSMAVNVADALDYVGVMCLELFLKADGDLLANEISPRPHNSGHWTLDACYTDQFEQHIRAVCGLPLGSSQRFSDATMQNILGSERAKIEEHFPNPKAHVHLYGKNEWRPGRKMGHVTFLDRPDKEQLQSSSNT